jgi:hypothetical protein
MVNLSVILSFLSQGSSSILEFATNTILRMSPFRLSETDIIMSLLRADECEKLQQYIVSYYESQATPPNRAVDSGRIAASLVE